MKRPVALQALSTTHHVALDLALRISDAKDEPSIEALMASLPPTFADEIEPHMQQEERLLLPLLEASGETELAQETRDRHDRLRALAAKITAGDRSALQPFWIELHALVRFEERRLYDTAEQVLPDGVLAQPLQERTPE